MNELLTALAFSWRTMDGRQSAPKYWNVYLYAGLLIILCGYVYLEYMTAWQALGIYAVVLTYILSGYRSLTAYWVKYLYKKHVKYEGYPFRLIDLEKWYKADDKGFASYHMSYRYMPACAAIAFILSSDVYVGVIYTFCGGVAGLLFPLRVRHWSTEASARLTEGVLGAVIIGGWTWLF